MIGIPIGLAYANAAEWLIHKQWLHGYGKKKDSFWSFHWREHHRNSRRNGHKDPDYEKPLLRGWNGQSKEAASLLGGVLLHLPLLPVAPFFTATVTFCAAEYYFKHRKAHLDPEWAREHLPWHYDHHMGPDQDANWCVVRPWADRLLGTRVPYVGTEREREDLARAAAREERRAGA